MGTDLLAFGCTSQDKTACGHVAHKVQRDVENVIKGCRLGTLCPGNERCDVESDPDRGSPDATQPRKSTLRSSMD